MKTEHPIIPPPELVREWTQYQGFESPEILWQQIAHQAARWGADQELEACCEWLHAWTQDKHPGGIENLRTARRPKPPSLKDEVRNIIECLVEGDCVNDEDAVTLHRALEALPDV